MQNNVDRAKQFLPFDALKGFKEALNIVENNITIDNRFEKIKLYENIFIKYFNDVTYLEIYGIVKEINLKDKYLIVSNTCIYFNDILEFVIKLN